MKLKKLFILTMILSIILAIFPTIIISTTKSPSAIAHNEEILEKVQTLQNLAIEYKEQSNSSTSATLLCMQYITKDRYNSTLWKMLLGDIESAFITYLEEKENVPTFKNEVLLDPITNKEIDFVHMIAPLNAYIKNGDTVMSMINTDYSGWAGDLLTLLEEVTVYRTTNNITDNTQLQEYSNSLLGTNNGSTFPTEDILADLDAKALYKDSSNNINDDFYGALCKYYVSTDSTYNATNRLETAQVILGNTKENVKNEAKEVLTDTSVLGMNLKEKLFANSENASKVTSTDIDIAAQSFANYIYKDPAYFKLKESNGTGTIGGSAIKIKIIDSHTNLERASVEVENSIIASAETEGEYVKITPLSKGTTKITVYSEDKTLSSTYELTSICEHTYEQQYDGSQHWKECSKCEEEEEGSRENHSYGDPVDKEDGENHIQTCITCSAEMTETHTYIDGECACGAKEPCNHIYEQQYNGSQHWKECSKCEDEEEGSRENHKLLQWKDTKNGVHSSKCDKCEYELVQEHHYNDEGSCIECNAMIKEEECNHIYELECNQTHHWKTCQICGEMEKNTLEAHEYNKYIENNNDETHSSNCKICQYRLTQEHNYDKDGLCIECEAKKFKKTTSLSVNNIDMIKNGKLIQDKVVDKTNTDFYVKYDKFGNNLIVSDYKINNIIYEDMGTDFNIITMTTDKNNVTIQQYNPYTGIKLQEKEEDSISENDIIVVSNIKSGEIYEGVTKLLANSHSKLQIYDISIERENVKVQPKGKVTVSIPIESDIDISKVVAYRIDEDKTKTEYTVRIENYGLTNYATFETDHFSTYVLAQKDEDNLEQEKENEGEQKGEETDNTIATENIPKAGIESGIIIIAFLIIIGRIFYKKYKYMKDIE